MHFHFYITTPILSTDSSSLQTAEGFWKPAVRISLSRLPRECSQPHVWQRPTSVGTTLRERWDCWAVLCRARSWISEILVGPFPFGTLHDSMLAKLVKAGWWRSQQTQLKNASVTWGQEQSGDPAHSPGPGEMLAVLLCPGLCRTAKSHPKLVKYRLLFVPASAGFADGQSRHLRGSSSQPRGLWSCKPCWKGGGKSIWLAWCQM